MTQGRSSVTQFALPHSPDSMSAAEHFVYCRDILHLPGPVDRWLTANSRSPNISFLKNYLMLENILQEYVICSIEYVCVKVSLLLYSTNLLFDRSLAVQSPNNYHGAGPDHATHCLYITAHASPGSCTLIFMLNSPRALLDRFVGSSHAVDAPEWTQWTTPIRVFQQPKMTFAALFVRMATWDLNRDQVIFPGADGNACLTMHMGSPVFCI